MQIDAIHTPRFEQSRLEDIIIHRRRSRGCDLSQPKLSA